jgi:hypothetical protein
MPRVKPPGLARGVGMRARQKFALHYGSVYSSCAHQPLVDSD